MTLVHAIAVSVPIFISGIFTTTYHLTATMEGAEKPFAGPMDVSPRWRAQKNHSPV